MDIIPYGGVARNGIVEPIPGVTLDVTGMAEAAEHAVTVGVGGQEVRLPTLASMVALKIIAWAYRGDTTDKDARDLGPLLDATHHGPFSEGVWADEEAGERWDYVETLMGPYRVGREVRATWRSESVRRLRQNLAGSQVRTLAARIVRSGGGSVDRRIEQLVALDRGLDAED